MRQFYNALSAKNTVIIVVILIIVISGGGFGLFAAQDKSGGETTTYYTGVSNADMTINGKYFPSGTNFNFIVTKHKDGSYTIYDQTSMASVLVNANGFGGDGNEYYIQGNTMTYLNRANGVSVNMNLAIKQQFFCKLTD